MKYKPLDKYELFKLVQDESIYLGDIDTSAITDMSFLFNTNFRKDFSGIDKWDVSSVTNMNEMFYCCFDFNENLHFAIVFYYPLVYNSINNRMCILFFIKVNEGTVTNDR